MKSINIVIGLLLIVRLGFCQDVIFNVTEANGANTGSITAVIAVINDMPLNYSFEWTDSDGNLIIPQPSCNDFDCTLSNLNPGRYCVRITASGSECEAYGCVDVEGVSCSNKFSYYFEYSDPECSNTNDGFITFHFDDPDLCWLYGDNTFEWDDGTLDRTKSDLQPGSKHCITIRADEDDSCPGCYAYLCTEVPALDSEPLTVDGSKGDICYSEILHESDKPYEVPYSELVKSYGWIFANSSGGYGDITIRWLDNGSNNWERIIRDPGVYCAEVSDECGNVVIKCWEIVILHVVDHYCLAPHDPELLKSQEFRSEVDNIWSSRESFDAHIFINNNIELILLYQDSIKVKYEIRAIEEEIEIGTLEIVEGNNIEYRLVEKDDINSEEVFVYPNPNNGHFNIVIDSEVKMNTQVSVFSIDGKLLQSNSLLLSKGRNKQEIDIGLLGNGIYLLKIGDKTPMKIIVNH